MQSSAVGAHLAHLNAGGLHAVACSEPKLGLVQAANFANSLERTACSRSTICGAIMEARRKIEFRHKVVNRSGEVN